MTNLVGENSLILVSNNDHVDIIIASNPRSLLWWMRHTFIHSFNPVLVNRCPSDEFIPQRDLRQGDPLTPFLFTIMAEGLSITPLIVNSWQLSHYETLHGDTSHNFLDSQNPLPIITLCRYFFLRPQQLTLTPFDYSQDHWLSLYTNTRLFSGFCPHTHFFSETSQKVT